MFKPHFMRYYDLMQDMIHRNGQGWVFGRSSGVLGQIQCLAFLEQILRTSWLNDEQSAWTRRACHKLLDFLIQVFWDEDKQWFSFRDEYRSCYAYRTGLSMCWDL